MSGRVDAASGIGFIGAFEVGVVVGFLCMSGGYESGKIGCKKKQAKTLARLNFAKLFGKLGKNK